MLKNVKLCLSVFFMFLLWPLMYVEMFATHFLDIMDGNEYPGDRDQYTHNMLMSSKVLWFCLRMFHTPAESDQIIQEHKNRKGY